MSHHKSVSGRDIGDDRTLSFPQGLAHRMVKVLLFANSFFNPLICFPKFQLLKGVQKSTVLQEFVRNERVNAFKAHGHKKHNWRYLNKRLMHVTFYVCLFVKCSCREARSGNRYDRVFYVSMQV